MPLSGHIILVTGASGGLGSAVVPAFEKAGAVVLPVARSPGPDGISADLTSDAAHDGPCNRQSRKPDASMCWRISWAAGAGGKPVAETDDATWRSMLAMNLDAAFYTARAALPHMTAAGRGRILMVGSARVWSPPRAQAPTTSPRRASLRSCAPLPPR